MLYKNLKVELEALNWYIAKILQDIDKQQDVPTYEQLDTLSKTASKIVEKVNNYKIIGE